MWACSLLQPLLGVRPLTCHTRVANRHSEKSEFGWVELGKQNQLQYIWTIPGAMAVGVLICLMTKGTHKTQVHSKWERKNWQGCVYSLATRILECFSSVVSNDFWSSMGAQDPKYSNLQIPPLSTETEYLQNCLRYRKCDACLAWKAAWK